MKSFEIIYHPTENEIKEMIQLDQKTYSELDCGNLQKCLRWKEKCPEIYTAIKYNNKIIGYINFAPIKKACYNKIKSGNLKDYELEESDLLNFKEGLNYCLFMSIVIDKKFRNADVFIRLMNAFFEKINCKKQKNAIFDNVLCDCVSKEGEKLVEKNFNAKFICDSKNGTKIYEFKL